MTARTQPRRRGPAAITATPAGALVMSAAAGGAIAVQAYVNGRLGRHLGSAELAAAVNNSVGTVALAAIAFGGGAVARCRARVRALGRPPLWQFLGGLGGALLVLVSALAAPEVGVALLTVALVCGTTAGSLVVDAIGLGPAGPRRMTMPRVAGVALAIAATAVSAVGAQGSLRFALLGLAVLAGVASAVQQAVNGRVASATGEPFVASLVNFAVGLTALGTAAAVTVAVHRPDIHGAPPALWIGGFLGAFVVVVLAIAVQTLGVLRTGLALVAGQTAGALVMDLIAPAGDKNVTVGTVAGVVLTVVAVAISGRGQSAPAPG